MMKTLMQLESQKLSDITAADIQRQREEQAMPPKKISAVFDKVTYTLIEDVWLFEFNPLGKEGKQFFFNRIRGYYTPVLEEPASWEQRLAYQPVYFCFGENLEPNDKGKFTARKYRLNEVFSRPEDTINGISTFCVYCRKQDLNIVFPKIEQAVERTYEHFKSEALSALDYFICNKKEYGLEE